MKLLDKYKLLYIITIIMSICAMVYEFLIAETLTAILGNTILRYNTTVGIYVASMGFGALIIDAIFKDKSDEIKMVMTEIGLSFLGFFSALIILIANYYIFNYPLILNIIVYFFVLVIGIMTGFEIPLMFRIYKKYLNKEIGDVFFYDFLGSFIGAILFPLIIIKSANVFDIGAFFAIINIIMALILIKMFNLKDLLKIKLVLYFYMICLFLFILCSTSQYLIEFFYV